MRWTEEQLQAYQHQHSNSSKPSPSAPVMEPPKRGRAGDMNKTEAAYAQVLELMLRAGEIHWYGFERVKLRLADSTFYTPDFPVMGPDGRLEFHEVKGFWRDDARIKIKVAAEQYPFRFIAVTKRRKRDGGGWAREVFG